MAPGAFVLSKFIWSSVGTTLAVASANSFNQIIETDKDALMARTQLRMLPTGKMTRAHATLFGVATGGLGVAALYTFVNPLAAGLALANIILYAGVYTPLKQVHTINTHVVIFQYNFILKCNIGIYCRSCTSTNWMVCFHR